MISFPQVTRCQEKKQKMGGKGAGNFNGAGKRAGNLSQTVRGSGSGLRGSGLRG